MVLIGKYETLDQPPRHMEIKTLHKEAAWLATTFPSVKSHTAQTEIIENLSQRAGGFRRLAVQTESDEELLY